MKEKTKKTNVKSPNMSKVFCLRTQNPLRFPGFTVVVVTFFVKILDDFRDLFSECVLPPHQPILWCNRLSEEKWQFLLDVKQKTHILLTKINEEQIR